MTCAKIYDIIRRPIITEKATNNSAFNKVIVEVSKVATKACIKKAFKEIFGVEALSVNTITVKGKTKRYKGRLGKRSDYKKAIVSLPEGKTVDFMKV